MEQLGLSYMQPESADGTSFTYAAEKQNALEHSVTFKGDKLESSQVTQVNGNAYILVIAQVHYKTII